MKLLPLFTIGYERRNIQEYISTLETAGIKILIDVRETAWSYKRDFCKSRLNAALEEAGITYFHLKAAGNPKKFRQNMTSIEDCLNIYKEYLIETRSGLTEIESLLITASLEKELVCLACYERDPCLCHRSIIAEQIENSFGHIKLNHL